MAPYRQPDEPSHSGPVKRIGAGSQLGSASTKTSDGLGNSMAAKEKAKPIADRRQQLRLFFSADLSGGTAFKNRRPVEKTNSVDAWPAVFEEFFHDFDRAFRTQVKEARERESDDAWIAPTPQLWKINGDEMLFTELVYPDLKRRNPALSTSLGSFVELVKRFDDAYLPKGMGVRGCIWTAGFPLRNKPVRVVESNIDIIEDVFSHQDLDTGDHEPVPMTVTDYIGRDMDLGFRLAALAPPMRVVCSFDVAQFVTALPKESPVAVHHVGWRPLKGILSGLPYPILWLETGGEVAARHPWDTSEEYGTEEVRTLLSGRGPMSKTRFDELAGELDGQFPDHMIRAYASSEDMAEDHQVTWKADQAPAPTREIALTEQEDEVAVWADEIETITLDDLNQILLFLQENPDKIRELRDVLVEVAQHASYGVWEDKHQFHGKLFRLHHSLAFAGDNQRRLLEVLRLVQRDALRVRLHLRDGHVFLTDGLWVSSSIRVFPFIDESDLVIQACSQLGWMDWATCVVDPATGCGHSLLRYESPGVRRYGFDRSVRAVAFAAINTIINEIPDTRVAINDIRSGIPPVFNASGHERVLVLANMPFGLVPKPDTIARSTDGGRYGYQLTLDLFEAVDALADSLSDDAELRCVAVAYSVGSKPSETWVVPDRAYERFGRKATPAASGAEWWLWKQERLWRVNGKKEQKNPMPLTQLKLKADCRFYVREDARRGAVRKEYKGLTTQLKKEGYDHLAYGAVAIRHPRRDGAAT